MPYSKLNPEHRCIALCRSRGDRCRNTPAYGCKTCRYHGAKRPEAIKRGTEHGRYKHGERTKEAMTTHRQAAVRLADLETLARALGMITGPKTRGRRPG